MTEKHQARRPAAPKKPRSLVTHGHARVDPWYWLRDRDDPDVLAHLEAENAWTEARLAPVQNLRQALVHEMRSRIPPDEASPPYREGDWYYNDRYEPGKEYPLYCRRAMPDGDEHILLDCNRLAQDHAYFALRGFTVSPDGRRAAFGIDTKGNRFYTIRFLDLDTGEFLDDEVADVTSNIEWAADSRTILYVRQHRETLRSYQVWLHSGDGGDDQLIYQEDDETCWLGLEKSLSGRYLYLLSESTLATEVRCLPAVSPGAEPALFLPQRDNHEYYVTDGEDRFFILSNDGAVNFRIFECPLDKTARSAWKELVAHRNEVLIESMEVFADFIALAVVDDGLDRIEIVNRCDGSMSRITFDEQVYTASPVDNFVYRTRRLRFGFESPITPESIYDFDLDSGRQELVWRQHVPGGFDHDAYDTERHMVEVRDGTLVPLSLVYRKGLKRDGQSPLLVYGYGAYGISTPPEFDTDVFSLIDCGFVYAIAHVRGGAELGRRWYYAGRRRDKMNTFLDFIDVTRYLHARGYSSPPHTYATGRSAGGLLMGAVANLAPGLYNGIASQVPFVDVVTTMLDESIPLTTAEYDEWGNPNDRSSYFYMLGYSPYDNVREQAYPHLIATTGLHDSQVQYWEPAKWVQRVRETRTNDNLVLLYTDMEAGHSGKTGRYRALEDEARVFAFFLMLEEMA